MPRRLTRVQDEAAAKKKKEEEEKAKKEADKAAEKAKKEAEKSAAAASKPATPPLDGSKKNWFSSVTSLTPLTKARSGSVIGDPPQAPVSARVPPTSATPPTSSPLSGSPSKTRVAPATLGRTSGAGVPTAASVGAEGGESAATRAEKEAAYTADGVKWCEAGTNDIRVKYV